MRVNEKINSYLMHLVRAFLWEVGRPHCRHRVWDAGRSRARSHHTVHRTRGWSGSWTRSKNGSRRGSRPRRRPWVGHRARVCGRGHRPLLSLPVSRGILSWKEEKRKECLKHDVKIRMKQLLVHGAISATNIKQSCPVSSRCLRECDIYPSALVFMKTTCLKEKKNTLNDSPERYKSSNIQKKTHWRNSNLTHKQNSKQVWNLWPKSTDALHYLLAWAPYKSLTPQSH